MKSKIIISLPTMLLLYLICILVIYIPYQATKAENVEAQPIDISLGSVESMFEVNNLAPGDMHTSTIEVHNSGTEAFQYFISSNSEVDVDVLFDALEIEIRDSNGAILYSGKLRQLQQVSLGYLSELEEENLAISIILPREAGNELQGQSTQFSFYFLAQQLSENIDLPDEEVPGGGPIIDLPEEEVPSGTPGGLPKTATSWYNLLLFGTLILIGSGIILWRMRRKATSGASATN